VHEFIFSEAFESFTDAELPAGCIFNSENLFKQAIKKPKAIHVEKRVESNNRVSNETKLVAKELMYEYLQRLYKLLQQTQDIKEKANKMLDHARDKALKLIKKDFLTTDEALKQRQQHNERDVSVDFDEPEKQIVKQIRRKCDLLRLQIYLEFYKGREGHVNWAIDDPLNSSLKIVAQYSTALLLQHIDKHVGLFLDTNYFFYFEDGKPIIAYLQSLAHKQLQAEKADKEARQSCLIQPLSKKTELTNPPREQLSF